MLRLESGMLLMLVFVGDVSFDEDLLLFFFWLSCNKRFKSEEYLLLVDVMGCEWVDVCELNDGLVLSLEVLLLLDEEYLCASYRKLNLCDCD